MIFSTIAAALGGLFGSGAAAAGTAAGAAGAAASTAAGAGAAAGSIASGITAAAGLVGTAFSAYGQLTQAAAAKKAEELRNKQMNLEADRQRRQQVRQALVARSTALSNATAQGADGSSGFFGGQAQITAQAGSNIQGINQGQQLGQQMFSANRQMSNGQTLSSIGSGIQSIGSNIADNWDTYSRVF